MFSSSFASTPRTLFSFTLPLIYLLSTPTFASFELFFHQQGFFWPAVDAKPSTFVIRFHAGYPRAALRTNDLAPTLPRSHLRQPMIAPAGPRSTPDLLE